jgi:uncharacterized protein
VIQKITKEDNYYIYDISSNNILKVEKIIFDIIEEFKFSNEENKIPSFNTIESKYGSSYPKETIKKAYEEILNFRKFKNIFLFKKPKKMVDISNLNQIKEILDNNLEQLTLNVSEDCNLRCEYCIYSGKYIYERTHSNKKMSLGIASRAIEFFFKHNTNSERIAVTFYGGEPLLNFNLIRKCVKLSKKLALECGKDSDLTFSITTNGTLLDRKKINFLIEHNIGLLISLDGPKNIHDKYRKFINGKGSYDLIIENLKRIRELNQEYYKKKVGFSVVTLPEYLNSVIEFFGSHPLVTETENLIINLVSPDDTTFFENYDFKNNLKKYVKTMKKLMGMYEEFLVKENYHSPNFKPLKAIFDKNLLLIHRRELSQIGNKIYLNGICIPGQRRLFVSSGGDFYICEKMGESIKIGDVYKGFDYKAILNIIEKYRQISEKECLNCWLMRLCNLCFTSARKGKILDDSRKKENCEGMKSLFSQLIPLYCEMVEKNPQVLSYFDKYDHNL